MIAADLNYSIFSDVLGAIFLDEDLGVGSVSNSTKSVTVLTDNLANHLLRNRHFALRA